jgi:hypothetical protein
MLVGNVFWVKERRRTPRDFRKFTLVPELVYEYRHVTIVSSLQVPSIKAPEERHRSAKKPAEYKGGLK